MLALIETPTYAGNECRVVMNTSTGIYATFVMTVVAQEDMSRAIWPSCPAAGWATGVNTLTAIPNGNPLTTNGSVKHETHVSRFFEWGDQILFVC